MGISPWIKSSFRTQTAPLWQISLLTDSGTVDLSGLSDAALAISFKNLDITPPTEVAGIGTLHIVQANPGIVSYQVNANDVAVGNYEVRLWVTFANGLECFDLGEWNIAS